MNCLIRICAGTWLALVIPSALAAEAEFPGIEKLMKPEEYEAAGLERLSDAERQALNEWLIRYTAWEAPKQKRSKAVKKARFEPITTRVKGSFVGWSGDTVFELENGQIWQQRLDDRYRHQAENPEVQIYRNWAGYYWMKILETGKAVPVKRVK